MRCYYLLLMGALFNIGVPHPMFYPIPLRSGSAAAASNVAAIQSLLNSLKGTGDIAVIPSGQWHTDAPLTVDSCTLLAEPDAVLIAADGTDSPHVGITLTGSGPQLQNVTLDILGSTVRGASQSQHGIAIVDSVNHLAQGVAVSGAAAAGFFHSHAVGGKTLNCKSSHSLADGFHHTNVCKNHETGWCSVDGAGDDFFAVVSYQKDNDMCDHIVVHHFAGKNQQGAGRGCTCVGGMHVQFMHDSVSQCWTRGLYVAAENAFLTYGVNDCLMDSVNVNGTGVQGPPYTNGADGAFVWSYSSMFPVSNVAFKNCVITNELGPLVTVLPPNTSHIDVSGVIQG